MKLPRFKSLLILSLVIQGSTGCEVTAFEKKIHKAIRDRGTNTSSSNPTPDNLLISLKGSKKQNVTEKAPDIKFNVICPKGTSPAGKPPPLGREEWCEKGEFVKKVRHGPALSWYEDGNKKSESLYTDGKLTGAVSTYSQDGELIEVKTYRNGEPDGRWIKWNADGEKEFDGFVRGQEKVGKWILYDRNGFKSSEGGYVGGKKAGTWTEFYPSGKPRERNTYVNGRREGKFTSFSELGYPLEQGSFKNNKRQGLWKFFHPTGQLKEQGNYERGKKVGVWTSFDVYGRPNRNRDHGGRITGRQEVESENGFKEL
jgi:antitoxin component YwqK of YwqJK toxin-antitoxin module